LFSSVCPVDAAQQTLVRVTGDSIEFVGTHAFYGVEHCAMCLHPNTVSVHIFAEPPAVDPFDLSAATGEIWFGPFSVASTKDETVSAGYRDPTMGSFSSDDVRVSVTDAPEAAGFEPPFAKSDLPRLRFTVESVGSLEMAGVVDAVYCDAAGYVSPCE
jgi:hypothetical protein